MKETKLWINGQWQDAKESYELKSPYSGEAIARVAKASIQDVERAIDGAQQAFHSFKKTTAYERAEILYKVVNLMRQRKEVLFLIHAIHYIVGAIPLSFYISFCVRYFLCRQPITHFYP